MNRIGRERGWGPTNRAAFDAQTALRGAYAVGDPAAVAEKILFWHEVFGQDRTLVQMAIGDVPHREVLRAIELLGTEVAPLVRADARPAGTRGGVRPGQRRRAPCRWAATATAASRAVSASSLVSVRSGARKRSV